MASERASRGVDELLEHLNADETANIILKGHLLIEEKLTTAIEGFMRNPEFLEDARLTFSQKLSICRSAFPGDCNGPLWDVVSRLNRLRNALSHSLDGDRRIEATESLVAAYAQATDAEVLTHEREGESHLFISILSTCLGFVAGVSDQMARFKPISTGIN